MSIKRFPQCCFRQAKKIHTVFILLIFIILTAELLAQPIRENAATTVLYNKVLSDSDKYPELLLNNVTCRFTSEGLMVTGKEDVIQLNKYYSLGERLVRYHVVFAADTKAIFRSNVGDFKLIINVPEQTISIETSPAVWKRVTIRPENDYLLEIQRNYQHTKVIFTDMFTGVSNELEVNCDGSGGEGVGAVKANERIVNHWDYYCFGLQEGAALTVKQICVQAQECDLTLLLYGDSQSQPESYFPAKDFPESWTQLIMSHIKGKAISSGRSGGTIRDVLKRIKNELPYVKAKYVMVTIGTNGGNTEENLSELVEYILNQGSIPILNSVPCNEHASQLEINPVIEKIRQKYGIKGCRFDLATSLNHDGKEVDKTTMWHEDYTATTRKWGHVYHHPNVKGSRLMYLRTLIDTPEIYE
jgi:hypothetical protein